MRDVDVSEVPEASLLRGEAAVSGPRLAPGLSEVRGVREGAQPGDTC